MSDTSRKWIGRGIQAALVVLAIAFVIHWVRSRIRSGVNDLHVSALTSPPDSLGPGDLRIYNADSSVDLILIGDRIAAGLSPRTVAEVRSSMDSSAKSDTGLGGSIAQLVQKTVAGAIATHAEFPLADLRDIRYENGKMVFDWKTGSHHALFESTNVNGRKAADTFRKEDAERFIAAVRARQKALGLN